jgi:hypothetical protein
MLMLPASLHAPGQETRVLGRLQGTFELGNSPRHSISVTYVPESVAAPGWTFCPRNAPQVAFRDLSNQAAENIAGKLEGAWIDQLVREVWHE